LSLLVIPFFVDFWSNFRLLPSPPGRVLFSTSCLITARVSYHFILAASALRHCQLCTISQAQAIPTQPFSPPAFVAPPPPLPTKPPVQHTSATQVADPFAPVSAKSATTEFDPFADFDAKFSELVLKSSSTVNAFESPLPVQPLPKSATVDTSFPIPQPANTSQLFNPFQSQASEDTQSLNAATFCERAPITRNCDNSDKYSALAELDQMFHHSGRPNAAGGEKPPWLPSGKSAAIA
ncbi:hypothetical protein COOONC_28328, partial [Cooperia oncophora]